MHPEHIEHYARTPTIRLEGGDMRRITVVVRCGRVRRWRLKAAMVLMRIAGRLGGFKSVRLTRED